MFVVDTEPSDPFGPRRPKIILLQYLQHCASDITNIAARHGKGKHDHRHHHMLRHISRTAFRSQRSHTAGRQPPQLHRENINQQQRKKESRHTAAKKRCRHYRIISFGILMDRTENACRNRKKQTHQKRNAHQQRWADMAADHGTDRLIRLHGISQITMQKLSQPYEILHQHGLVQSQGYSLRLHGRLRHTRSLKHLQRASRQAHDSIIDNCYSDQHRNSNQNSF